MNRAWILLAGLALGSCGDGAIGEEGCVGVTCARKKSFQPEVLIVDLKEVSTLDAAPLPIAWTVPNLCETPCTVPPQLYAAGNGAVWNLPRGQLLPAPELVQANGSRDTQRVNPPSELTSLSRLSLVGTNDGRLVGHAEWILPTGELASEMLVFGTPNAPLQRTPLTGLVRARLPPAAILGDQGYLFYDDGVDRDDPPFAHNVVRNVYPDGSTDWQQGAFPSLAEIVAGSAVRSTGSVVIPAHQQPRGSRPLYGMLWLTSRGEIQRLNVVGDASWRGITLLDFGADRFVMAAASDLRPANGTTSETTQGNIDVISFQSSNVDRGFRLMHDCFYPLTLNGVAADSAGTLYVSSVAGQRDQPRGLLCRLPADGTTPRCFQSDPMHALTAIVAIAPNVLIGALDDNLIRIDLP